MQKVLTVELYIGTAFQVDGIAIAITLKYDGLKRFGLKYLWSSPTVSEDRLVLKLKELISSYTEEFLKDVIPANRSATKYLHLILVNKNPILKRVYRDLRVDCQGFNVIIKDVEPIASPKDKTCMIFAAVNDGDLALGENVDPQLVLNELRALDFKEEKLRISPGTKALLDSLGEYRFRFCTDQLVFVDNAARIAERTAVMQEMIRRLGGSLF